MLLAFNANAATYYVGPSGNDSNSGLTLYVRLKTINAALNKAVDGDTIYLTNGTYAEQVSVNQNNLTLSAYPGSTPIIDGATVPNSDWYSCVNINGNYDVFSGVEVRNCNLSGAFQGGYGVQVYGHHNLLSKLKVHHTWGAGIVLNGDYNTFEDSSIYQATYVNNGGNSTIGWGQGISVARNTSPDALAPGIASYATVRRNKVYNNWGEGIGCFESDHCVIVDNVSYDNWTVNLYLSDSTNATVARNLVYASSNPAIPTRAAGWIEPGIILADEVSNGTTIPKSANNIVANNLIYNAELQAMSWSLVPAGLNNTIIANNTVVDGALSTGFGGDPLITNVNSQIRNNIIIDGTITTSSVPSNQGITFSNNNWEYTAPVLAISDSDNLDNAWITRTGVTTAGNLTGNYFKLISTSQNINSGVVITEVPRDFFSNYRNWPYSIGGHEYGATNTALTVTGVSAVGNYGGYGWVNWNGNIPSTGVIKYGLSPTALTKTITDAELTVKHTKRLSNLALNTKYYYSLVATSPTGGSTQVYTGSFTTLN